MQGRSQRTRHCSAAQRSTRGSHALPALAAVQRGVEGVRVAIRGKRERRRGSCGIKRHVVRRKLAAAVAHPHAEAVRAGRGRRLKGGGRLVAAGGHDARRDERAARRAQHRRVGRAVRRPAGGDGQQQPLRGDGSTSHRLRADDGHNRSVCSARVQQNVLPRELRRAARRRHDADAGRGDGGRAHGRVAAGIHVRNRVGHLALLVADCPRARQRAAARVEAARGGRERLVSKWI